MCLFDATLHHRTACGSAGDELVDGSDLDDDADRSVRAVTIRRNHAELRRLVAQIEHSARHVDLSVTDPPLPRNDVGDRGAEMLSVPVERSGRVVGADVRGDDLRHGAIPFVVQCGWYVGGDTFGESYGDVFGGRVERSLHARPKTGCKDRIDGLVSTRHVRKTFEAVVVIGHAMPPSCRSYAMRNWLRARTRRVSVAWIERPR